MTLLPPGMANNTWETRPNGPNFSDKLIFANEKKKNLDRNILCHWRSYGVLICISSGNALCCIM